MRPQLPPLRSQVGYLVGYLSRSILTCLLACQCSSDPSDRPHSPAKPVEPLAAGEVAWGSWQDRPREKRSKPTFLFLYTRRSYWCRDFAERTFHDPLLARELGRVSWPVRADADRRPDLVSRYGMGGWPSLTVLYPDGELVTGTTYVDPDDFSSLLRRIDIAFSTDESRDDLSRNRERLRKRVEADAQNAPGPVPPSRALLEALVDSVEAAAHRGASLSPETWLFLAEYGRIANESETLRTALTGLEALPVGDEGLVYRAVLTGDGRLNDVEMPLSLNARRLIALSAAATLGGHPEVGTAARSLAESLKSRLLSSTGPLLHAGLAGFGKEDSAWVLLPAAPGRKEAPVETRVQSMIDTVAYTAWNALAASGLAALGDPLAADIVDGLAELRTPEGLLPRTQDAGSPYFLEDQAAVALASIDLVESADSGRLAFATELAQTILVKYRTESGSFTDRWPEPGPSHLPALDREMPSAAGLTARLFIRLAGRIEGSSDASSGASQEMVSECREAARQLLTRHINPNLHRAAQLGSLGRALLAFIHGKPPESSGGALMKGQVTIQ